MTYNGTGWHTPTSVAKDARPGTGLTAAWASGVPDETLWIYYIDRSNRLQELRGTHSSDTWEQCSLGTFDFQTSANHTTLSMILVGDCDTSIHSWLCYQTSDGTVRQLWKNRDTDTWTPGINFTNVEPQSGFVIYMRKPVWQMYMMNTSSQVVQYECVECCKSIEWKEGTRTFATVLS